MRQPLCVLAMLTLGGCPADDHDSDHDHGHPVELTFQARAGGAPVACGTTIQLGTPATEVTLGDARLYVSAVQVRGPDGAWVDVTLDDDGMWQDGTVALLDFEDGTAGCADSGTAETNHVITGSAAVETWDAVRFDLGVPDASNHVDGASAPAPLNAPGMFWVWQSGYKFARVDFVVTGPTPSRWNVHLGSTGCVSDAPTLAPEAPCGRPNRPTLTVEAAQEIELDLGALVAGADLTVNTPDTPPGCMSAPTEPEDCDPTFAALGLDFGTGACASDCSGQAFATDAAL